MSSIWELQNDINDRNNMRDNLQRISRNLKTVAERAGNLATNLDNNLAVNDSTIALAQRTRQIASDLKGYINYIDNCIIPHLDWDISQANIGIENLRQEEG